MESQAGMAGILRHEAQSAAPYEEAIDQTDAAAGRTIVGPMKSGHWTS
jgi:hypothetical protein